jgi:hypothetical protein
MLRTAKVVEQSPKGEPYLPIHKWNTNDEPNHKRSIDIVIIWEIDRFIFCAENLPCAFER